MSIRIPLLKEGYSFLQRPTRPQSKCSIWKEEYFLLSCELMLRDALSFQILIHCKRHFLPPGESLNLGFFQFLAYTRDMWWWPIQELSNVFNSHVSLVLAFWRLFSEPEDPNHLYLLFFGVFHRVNILLILKLSKNQLYTGLGYFSAILNSRGGEIIETNRALKIEFDRQKIGTTGINSKNWSITNCLDLC